MVFDPTYYLLALTLTFVLLCTAVLALRLSRRLGTMGDRDKAKGTGLIAAGALIANTGAVSLIAILRDGMIGGVLYLQVEFLIVFLGFGAVFYGIETILLATYSSNGSARWPRSKVKQKALISAAYALAVVFSLVYLLNPATYTVSYSGTTHHAAQQTVFWIPAFLALSLGIVALLPAALRSQEVDVRRHASWFVTFAALVLIGLLKEATVIPSSGDPLTDLLLAFVPFAVGAFSLYHSLRILQGSPSHVAPVDFSASPATHPGQRKRDALSPLIETSSRPSR